MRIIYFLLIAIFLASCTGNVKKHVIDTPAKIKLSVKPVKNIDSSKYQLSKEELEVIDSEMETRYVVIADTGSNYYDLHDKMFALQQQLNIPIDTMNRMYDKVKNLITLPDDYEDDIIAGDYFPRRETASNLSIEYLSLYKNSNTTDKMMALVTGIYETKQSADSAYQSLTGQKNAFVVKADIYMGCLH